MLTIPLSATPSQSLRVTLAGQRCVIRVDQKYQGGVFLSLTANDVQILDSRMCRDRVKLVRGDYAAFAGNLAFVDTQGASDPDYTGFGTRYKLVYVP
jgi:hypothetical protein